MTKNEVMNNLNNLSDKDFIEIIRKSKTRIQKIEKKEKQAIIDEKFREKGITCPICQSFKCVKNGFKNDKQRYFCKDCKGSFDAFKNHFSYYSKLNYKQWDLLIKIAMLGQSSRIIANFIKTSTKTAWFNRQKLMKSQQLSQAQKKFKKLNGRIEIDETFIKEIHKGNFKSKDDRRKQYIDPKAKSTKTCIVIAVDENFNLYVQATKTKKLQRNWIENNLTNKIITENSTLATDMLPIYDRVALQTKSKLQQFKLTANKTKCYQNLKNVSKAQSNLKEFLTHYHGIGFTNIQDYLNLWKWKYQHYGLNPYQQSNLLYFNL